MPMLLLVILTLSLRTAPATVADAGWLAGCWEFSKGDRHTIEHWTAPEGGTMLGLSRTVVKGKTVEYEFVVIREAGAGLEFVAKPSRQAEATFASIGVSDGELAFENPDHDFPQRVIYQRQADGSLIAAIEGRTKGEERRITFPYRRAACPS